MFLQPIYSGYNYLSYISDLSCFISIQAYLSTVKESMNSSKDLCMYMFYIINTRLYDYVHWSTKILPQYVRKLQIIEKSDRNWWSTVNIYIVRILEKLLNLFLMSIITNPFSVFQSEILDILV